MSEGVVVFGVAEAVCAMLSLWALARGRQRLANIGLVATGLATLGLFLS